MRKVPLLIACAALVAVAQAPMASIPGPSRSPDAKKIELPRDTQCRMLPFSFDIAKPAMVQITMSNGNYCATQFKPDGIVFKKFQIVQQPKSGVVNLNDKDQRWYYRPKSGFKGTDVFVMDLEGYDRIKWGKTQMAVHITVQ